MDYYFVLLILISSRRKSFLRFSRRIEVAGVGRKSQAGRMFLVRRGVEKKKNINQALTLIGFPAKMNQVEMEM